MPARMAVVPVEYSKVLPGSDSSGNDAMYSEADGADIMPSTFEPGPYSSAYSRPLAMCNRCSRVIARRGSAGSDHCAMGAGSSTANFPSPTRTPMSDDVTLLATEYESMIVSGPSSGWYRS